MLKQCVRTPAFVHEHAVATWHRRPRPSQSLMVAGTPRRLAALHRFHLREHGIGCARAHALTFFIQTARAKFASTNPSIRMMPNDGTWIVKLCQPFTFRHFITSLCIWIAHDRRWNEAECLRARVVCGTCEHTLTSKSKCVASMPNGKIR